MKIQILALLFLHDFSSDSHEKQHILLQHSNYKTDISIQIFLFVNSKISLKLMKSDYNDKNINSTTRFIFT